MIASVAIAVAATSFAPPLDRPFRHRVEQVRIQAGKTRRFVAERRIVFRRDPAGLVADVTLVRLDAQAEPEIVRNYRLSTGGLLNRTLRFHLDGDRVVSLDDLDANWVAMLAPITRLPPPPDRSIPDTARPGAALAALPPAARLPVLAGPVRALIAGADAALQPGDRAVTIPAPGPSGPGGANPSLTGRQLVTRVSPNLLRIVANLSATGLVLVRTRDLDPLTGMMTAETETVTRRLGTLELVTRSGTSLTPW